MIDHVGFPVSDYARSKAFYEKALAPLGYTVIMEVQQNEHDAKAAGFGAGGKPDFWIGGEGGLNHAMHIAIVARDRATVDAFYQAAHRGGRARQRCARHPGALPSELLRRLRARSRWAQYRGGMSRAGVIGVAAWRYAGLSIFACTSSSAVAKP